MREKPILFSTPMVNAILEGKKTMTRRVFRNVLKKHIGYRNQVAGLHDETMVPLSKKEFYEVHSPYQKGDILWVRETFASTDSGEIIYKADPIFNDCTPGDITWDWKPSIHMPRKAARIFLEVLSVRVEHLQNITEVDAKAEGVFPVNPLDLKQMPMSLVEPGGRFGKGQIRFNSYRAAFYQLWKTINEKRGYGWESNPWVWVIEFRRDEK